MIKKVLPPPRFGFWGKDFYRSFFFNRIWFIGSPHQEPSRGFLTIWEKKHKKPLRSPQRLFSIRYFQGSPWNVTTIPSFIPYLTITHIVVSVSVLRHLIRVLCVLRFLVVVYGFELLVGMGLVSLVLVFVVTCFFGCGTPPILVVSPSMFECIYQSYMSICMYYLPKRHMMRFHF